MRDLEPALFLHMPLVSLRIVIKNAILLPTQPLTTTFTSLKGTMVTLRTRSPATANGSNVVAPPPAHQSIARRFVHQKSAAPVKKSDKSVNGSTKKDGRKRVKEEEDAVDASAQKRKTTKKEMAAPPIAVTDDALPPLLSRQEIVEATTIEYPRLPFDLDAAMAHLRAIDVRFRPMLDSIDLKPYEEVAEGRVKELDLFRTLSTSILGQQVSWLAARAIVYRFVRLFHPTLPEKPDFDALPREALPFPHPIDVCQSDDAFLRTAGLSGAKVKYVKDVARRFSDGRLDARRIITLDEDACIAELVQIKGVGRWTAEMLLMFALRRGNILPVGDLGVQRGMVLFFTSDHDGPMVANKKRRKKQDGAESGDVHDASEKVPVVEEHLTESQVEVERTIADVNEHELGPHVNAPPSNESSVSSLPSLPEGISASLLKSRRDGKKAKGNAYLTPTEMEALAAPWAPFRSLAVYMMWALVD